LFGVAIVLALAGGLMLLLWVRDPRYMARPQAAATSVPGASG
jgi:hypothetical protein